MRLILLRGASAIGIATLFAIALLWLMRSPPDNIIPAEFRGIWLDQGAECGDIDAQVAITGTTVDYDTLSFKADGLSAIMGDDASLTGEAFPDGKTERETVTLRIRDHRRQLFIGVPGRKLGPFMRCAANAET
jgi:hypothetical protein